MCTALNYIEHLLIFASISDFASLVGIPRDIVRFCSRIKNWEITVGIKRYNSIVKRKRGRSMIK